MSGIYGCEFCNTTAGRQGCPIHRSRTVPVLCPEMNPVPVVSLEEQLRRCQDAQSHLARLAVERHDKILELQRELADRPPHDAMEALRKQVAELESEVARLRGLIPVPPVDRRSPEQRRRDRVEELCDRWERENRAHDAARKAGPR